MPRIIILGLATALVMGSFRAYKALAQEKAETTAEQKAEEQAYKQDMAGHQAKHALLEKALKVAEGGDFLQCDGGRFIVMKGRLSNDELGGLMTVRVGVPAYADILRPWTELSRQHCEVVRVGDPAWISLARNALQGHY